MADSGDVAVPAGEDIETLASEFVDSSYGRTGYSGWSLDRRIHGFLKRRGLGGRVNDGDLSESLACYVMALVSAKRHVGTPGA